MSLARPTGWLAGLALMLLLVPAAAAHVGLKSSIPTNGAILESAPTEVQVTLDGPADPNGFSLRVRDSNGTRVDLDDVWLTGSDEPTLHVSLPADLPDGAYQASWQAVSADDGHPASGKVGFAVGNGTPPPSSATHQPDFPWVGASGRLLAFLGIALALGAAVFLVWIPGAAAVPRKPALDALLLGAALHLLGVALLFKSTLDQTGLSSAAIVATSIGKVLLLRIGLGVGAIAFAAIASLPRVPARLPPYLAVLLLMGSGLGSARFGHASTAGLAGILVDAMHLFAAATWVGGLLVFLWLLADAARRDWTGDAVRVVGVRFGTVALMSVILLLAAGLGASLAILGAAAWSAPGSTLATTWGKALAAKVALTLAMLGLGAINRYGVLEPPSTGGFSGGLQRLVTRWAPRLRVLDGGAPSMRRLLAVEAAFGVLTLVLAAILTAVSPPADVAEAAQPLEGAGAGTDVQGAPGLNAGRLPQGGPTPPAADVVNHARQVSAPRGPTPR